MKKILISVIALIVLAGVAFKAKELIQTRTLSVSLTHATNKQMQESKSYLASILSDKSIKVATKMAGYIEHIYVDESQKVSKGTLLATIDESDINSNIELLRTTLAQQKNDLALAQQIYHRNQKLYSVGGLAKEQVDTSRVILQGKRSAIKATQQKIAQLEEQPIYIDQQIIGNVDKILTLSQQGLAQAEVKLTKKLNLPLGSTLNIRVVTKSQSGCVVTNDTLLHKENGLFVMAYIDRKFEAQKVEKVMEQKDKTMIRPCRTEAIARGSEVLLAQLPVYGEVEVREE